MSHEQVLSDGAAATVGARRTPRPERDSAYEERMRRFYEAVSRRPLLTKRTRYMNMGYWKDGPRSLDDACEAMARFMGEFASLGREDRVLDAGCGFGDQDVYWATRHAPREIVAVNISQVQLEAAARRVDELGLAGRVTTRLASATDLPFADGSFDKVVSIESAQHFGTRAAFFREAHRVLRPGGRIYTADIIPMPGVTIGNVALQAMALNRNNLYPRAIYEQKLEQAGFTKVAVTSVRDFTVVAFEDYMRRSAKGASALDRLRRRVRTLLMPTRKVDYVVARGDKS